jgi:tripartite-type tricarboxylate transporter receptor subunit TctC
MSAELLKMMAGLDMVHVPYKGASPMLADLMGGQIDLGFDNLPSTLPLIRSGKLRGLAVTTAQRWPGAPELPTLAESGVPGYDVGGWFGLFAPAGTPAAVLQAIQQAVAAQVKLPDVQRQMLDMGAEPVGNTPEEFARRVSEEVRRWRTVVDTLGLKVE